MFEVQRLTLREVLLNSRKQEARAGPQGYLRSARKSVREICEYKPPRRLRLGQVTKQEKSTNHRNRGHFINKARCGGNMARQYTSTLGSYLSDVFPNPSASQMSLESRQEATLTQMQLESC